MNRLDRVQFSYGLLRHLAFHLSDSWFTTPRYRPFITRKKCDAKTYSGTWRRHGWGRREVLYVCWIFIRAEDELATTPTRTITTKTKEGAFSTSTPSNDVIVSRNLRPSAPRAEQFGSIRFDLETAPRWVIVIDGRSVRPARPSARSTYRSSLTCAAYQPEDEFKQVHIRRLSTFRALRPRFPYAPTVLVYGPIILFSKILFRSHVFSHYARYGKKAKYVAAKTSEQRVRALSLKSSACACKDVTTDASIIV